MEAIVKTIIEVQALIDAPIDIVWKKWTNPEDIKKWNFASDDWHSPKAENDMKVGGKFNYRMEAKDASFGFDFWGVYTKIIVNSQIHSTLGDGRKLEV